MVKKFMKATQTMKNCGAPGNVGIIIDIVKYGVPKQLVQD